jgi:hypothetical protein
MCRPATLCAAGGGKQHIAIAVFTKASRRDITTDQEDDIAAITRKVYTLLATE